MPGKYWKPQEEQLLRQLWESGVHEFKLLAQKIERSEGAIKEKLRRMGLLVVVQKPQKKHTTTSVPLGKGLFTHEEALKVLAGVLEALREPGLDKLELQRLRILVDAIHTYDSVLEKFERWVEIEARLSEMDKRIAELQKTKTLRQLKI